MIKKDQERKYDNEKEQERKYNDKKETVKEL